MICQKCGTLRTSKEKVGYRESCVKCNEDLHTCLCCKFHDTRSYNECNEPAAEVVREKNRSNFCDFFEPKSGGPNSKTTVDLKAAAEALFKKK